MNRLGRAAAALFVVLSTILAVPAHGAELRSVRIGLVNASSDVGFFIADKKGYFAQEGIKAEFIEFDSGARMVAPLGNAQLEVGAGSVAAGLYNAVARGIEIKIVADKGSTPPGYGFQPLLVRKDHVDSGRFKSLKDLKGMKIAGSAPGSGSTSTLNEALKKAGLKYEDVDRVFLGFPQHLVALQNKAVDASMTTEPTATRAIEAGVAVRVMGDDEIYPHHQLAVVLYAGHFVKQQPEVARRFMRAYLKAVRDYNDALKDGKLAGPKADEVIAILTEYTRIKDASLYRKITPQGCNPDGRVHLPSLRNDLAFFVEHGDVKDKVSVEQVVDSTFVDWALKELGPYRPASR